MVWPWGSWGYGARSRARAVSCWPTLHESSPWVSNISLCFRMVYSHCPRLRAYKLFRISIAPHTASFSIGRSNTIIAMEDLLQVPASVPVCTCRPSPTKHIRNLLTGAKIGEGCNCHSRSCQTCHSWDLDNARMHEGASRADCCRYPPCIAPRVAVAGTDWCGEWTARGGI